MIRIIAYRQSISHRGMLCLLSYIESLHAVTVTYSLVKIAFDLKEIATEFFFPLSFRERPKIKYIKSLPKSTHGKDVIF